MATPSTGTNPLPGEEGYQSGAVPIAPAPTPAPVDTSSFTPAQLTAYDNAASLAVKPPPVINASTAGQPVTPITVPTGATTTTTPAVPSLDSVLSTYSTPSEAETTDTGNINTITDKIEGLLTDQGNKSTVEANLDATPGGVNDLTAQLNEINAQIGTLNDSANAATNTAENREAPMFAITGEQAQIARQKAVQMYGLSAAAAALTGQVSLAQTKVTQALSAEFDPITAAITSYQTLLSNAQDQMSEDEKTQATALSAALAARTAQVTQAASDKSDVYNVMLAAAKNGASNATLNAILATTNGGDATIAAGTSLETGTAGGDFTFTNTQLDKGSANAGVDAATFASYPPQTQNEFINGDMAKTEASIAAAISPSAAQVTAGATPATLDQINSMIANFGLTPVTTKYLQDYASSTYATAHPAPASSGGSFLSDLWAKVNPF